FPQRRCPDPRGGGHGPGHRRQAAACIAPSVVHTPTGAGPRMAEQPGALSPVLKQATPAPAARAAGANLHDERDRPALGGPAAGGATSTGHCPPRAVDAAQRPRATLLHGQDTTVMRRPLLQLTGRLGGVLPEGIDQRFYVHSGSEAVEAALRLARQATG